MLGIVSLVVRLLLKIAGLVWT